MWWVMSMMLEVRLLIKQFKSPKLLCRFVASKPESMISLRPNSFVFTSPLVMFGKRPLLANQDHHIPLIAEELKSLFNPPFIAKGVREAGN